MDKFLDSMRRVGNKGSLTRPLKERKIRWLFKHWWSGEPEKSEGNFIWYDHTGGQKGLTLQPTHTHLWTIKPGHWLGDDIVNAYAELLAIREKKLWKSKQLRTPALQYFFAPSFFMVLADKQCTNLQCFLNYNSKPPWNTITRSLMSLIKSISTERKAETFRKALPDFNKMNQEIASMATFIEQYRKQLHGNDIHLCNVAFFPVCTRSHWFLFVVDLNNFYLMMIDPMRDQNPISGRDIYHEKFLPYMLYRLDSDRFPANRYLRVREFQIRPKQDGGVDCGVYVCKYMDAILHGLDLGQVRWHTSLDVTTFRYRIAHEIKCGEARQMPDTSIMQRLISDVR